MSAAALDVVVLAGDRGPDDPLAAGAGVPGKVLVPILGKTMLTRVLEAVDGLERRGRIIVACRDLPEYAAAIGAAPRCRRVDPASGPAASAMAALDELEESGPVLLVTGDHPLLRPEWLEQFVARARSTGADAAVGVVDHAAIVERFPDSKRTRYRFSDISICGTNLFYFAGSGGRRVVEQWRDFETDRKKPWKIVGRLGPWNLVRYLLGRLSLAAAMDALSRRLGVRLAAVPVDWPEAAVDVDSTADLALVARLIEARERSAP